MSIRLANTEMPAATLPQELTQQIDRCIQANQIEPLAELLAAALRQYPQNPDLHHLLGWARIQQGRIQEAEVFFREAVRLKPDAAGSLNNLGFILMELERIPEAYQTLQMAIRLQPDFVPALSNAAFVLGRLGYFDRALPLLEKALALDPDYAEARHHLGYTLMNLDRLDEAEAQLQSALKLQPENPGYINTLGLLREHQHRIEEGTALFQRAIELQPKQAHAWNNLGNIHAAVWGNLEYSLACFERAQALLPHAGYVRHHRGMVELALGDFANGWINYEFRPTHALKPADRYGRPLWRGEPLDGKTILLHAEQGLGDTLQGIRYAELIKAAGATVVCEVQKPLVGLLARTRGIDLLLAEGDELPPHDYQIPLLSIPRVLGIPREQQPYLFASEERIEFWRGKIRGIAGLKIGIAWQGDRTFEYDWLRSIPLAEFAPLAAVPGCRLISLQKFQGVEQIADNREKVPVMELTPEIDAAGGAFVDTAAIMKHLDLVVTSDTAIAHLAGGLGVPVWLATAYAPDWRWMMEREDCLWYPSMRLFRQTQIRQWRDVFERMALMIVNDQARSIK